MLLSHKILWSSSNVLDRGVLVAPHAAVPVVSEKFVGYRNVRNWLARAHALHSYEHTRSHRELALTRIGGEQRWHALTLESLLESP